MFLSRQEDVDTFQKGAAVFYLYFLYCAGLSGHYLSDSDIRAEPALHDQNQTQSRLGHLTGLYFTGVQKKSDIPLTDSQVIQKLEIFCSYRERCRSEVIEKMRLLGVEEKEQAHYLSYLAEEKFLNEERFVQSFIRGKLQLKSWGKRKIIFALQQKKIPPALLQKYLGDIDEEQYAGKLETLLHKKLKSIKETDTHKRRLKLYTFALQKGFEPDVIKKTLTQLRL
jgi:regulatory protein